MNEPESDVQSGSGAAALEEKWAELNRVTNLLFAAVVVLSFTFTTYLGLLARRAGTDAAAAKTRADDTLRTVQQDSAVIRTFYSKLQDFAHTHPDFQARVLSRFTITGTNAPAAKK